MVLERLGPPLIQLNLSKNLKSFYVLSVWYGEFISSISIFAQVQMKLSSRTRFLQDSETSRSQRANYSVRHVRVQSIRSNG